MYKLVHSVHFSTECTKNLQRGGMLGARYRTCKIPKLALILSHYRIFSDREEKNMWCIVSVYMCIQDRVHENIIFRQIFVNFCDNFTHFTQK